MKFMQNFSRKTSLKDGLRCLKRRWEVNIKSLKGRMWAYGLTTELAEDRDQWRRFEGGNFKGA